RKELGMTQVLFAGFMGVSTKTVEAWEAGRNMPDGPARRILAMLQIDPTLPQKLNIVTK
ncbi:MAG: helix-turn-helix domain-containing protein, partial [Peptococcaceae bacterium]|nr:helix-turn-helix domain-containing protein [Peptococcaceae bacterium]